MSAGIISDIHEFSIHDGPGIRTTVFLKGCPLRCSWCHNPESMSPKPQILHSPVGDRMVGTAYTPRELADRLNHQAEILRANEGGVTFSGGEPLMQAEFIAEVMSLLDENMHIVLDTSGYGSEDDFKMLTSRSDLVYFDLKVMDSELAKYHTGRDNAPILHNLHILSEEGTPFVIRVPLIPGVTDTDENFSAIAEAAHGLNGLIRVDLLPYNKAAGGKYASVGREFKPTYDEKRPLNINTACFEAECVRVKVA